MPNNFTYNLNIPNPPNNPQTDVPNMKINTNSISSLLSIDHIGFNTNGSGIHKQVTLKNKAAPGLGDGDGVLYANLQGGQSWPFWQNALGSIQLLNGQPNTASATQGITYLPGKVILIWSSQTLDNNGNTIRDNSPFLFPFGGFSSNCFTVLFNAEKSSTGAEGLWIKTGTLSKTGFSIHTSASSGQLSPFYYVAIGN